MAAMNQAAMRAADALLRGVGGCAVLLRTPAAAVPGDDGEQLGLSVPQFQDVPLAPAVYRRVRPKIAGGLGSSASRAVQYELLISATAVNAALGSTGMEAAVTLFGVACGVLVDEVLLEIESATCSEIGGAAYMYRLLLRSPVRGGV